MLKNIALTTQRIAVKITTNEKWIRMLSLATYFFQLMTDGICLKNPHMIRHGVIEKMRIRNKNALRLGTLWSILPWPQANYLAYLTNLLSLSRGSVGEAFISGGVKSYELPINGCAHLDILRISS